MIAFKKWVCKPWICGLFVLMPIARQHAVAQTLSFTPKAGDKNVSVSGLPPGFTGEIHCQMMGGKSGTLGIKSANAPKPPFKLGCGGTLTAGADVEVWLVDRDRTQVGAPIHRTVPPHTEANVRSGPQWDVSVTGAAGEAVQVTITGAPPVSAKASDIHVLIGPAPGTDVTSAGATGPDAKGTFIVPVSNPLKKGDRITVNVLGGRFQAVAGGPDSTARSPSLNPSHSPAINPAIRSGEAGAIDATIAGEIRVAFTPDPKDTQTAIGGYLTGDPATLARIQSVYLEVLNGSDDVDKNADIMQGPTDAKYSASTYSFAVSSLKALAEGQSVHVHVCGSSAYMGTTESGSPTITKIPSTASLQAGWPVSGTGIPSRATIVSVDTRTQITISMTATAAGTVQLQFGDRAPVEQSCAEAGPQSATGGNAATPGAIEIVPVNPTIDVVGLYDLGRVKTYFSAGAEFHGSNGSLGTTSGFFAVDIDQNWLTTGTDTSPTCFSASDSASFRNQVTGRLKAKADRKAEAQSKPPAGLAACGAHPFRFLVNTYVDAELTQIPLTSSLSNASATQAAAPAVRASAAAPLSPSGALAISTAQGAYVEGGVYTPFVFPSMQWHFRGQANAFFIAPLAKYVFLDPDSTPAGATTAFNVYRAYAGGFRLGHFRLPAHFNQEGPELLSYLDVTAGKWENYRESNGTRGARLDVNGRYKIPFTILYIGFDANVGPGGSDFRLFAGTRVDVASILGRLLPSAN